MHQTVYIGLFLKMMSDILKFGGFWDGLKHFFFGDSPIGVGVKLLERFYEMFVERHPFSIVDIIIFIRVHHIENLFDVVVA